MSTVRTTTQVTEPRTRRRLRGSARSGEGFWARTHRRWREAELFSAPPRSDWSPMLRRVRNFGFALLVLEFVGMGVWSYIQASRFSLTADFGNYLQAAWELAHGTLNPVDTVQPSIKGVPVHFWTNAIELFMLPVALAYRIYPHAVTVKWMQYLGLVLAQGIAFAWICDLAARHEQDHPSRRSGPLLAAFGLLLLIGNPWFLWAGAVDAHGEPFVLPMMMGAARNLHRGRRSAWWWALAGIVSTGIGATYIAAVGTSAALSGRVRLKRGGWITVVAVLWFMTLSKLHLLVVGSAAGTFAPILTGGRTVQTQGTDIGMHSAELREMTANAFTRVTYISLIKTVLHHPVYLFRALWVNAQNLWATLSASGVLGLFWIPVSVPIVLVLLEGGFVRGFSLPGFQNIAVATLLPVGTIAIGAKLLSRRGVRFRRAVAVVAAVMAVYVAGWFVVWLPNLSREWLNVSPAAARVLNQLNNRIGPDDEVIADQGFVGGFAARRWAFIPFASSLIVQPHRPVWIILSPSQGIELADSASTMALITNLEQQRGMKLKVDKAGIWAFRWVPPTGAHHVNLRAPSNDATSGNVVAGAFGQAHSPARASQGYTANSGSPGYVTSGGYKRILPGIYRAVVTMSASSLTNVEVWDSTRNMLLRRQVVTNTHGTQTMRLTVRVHKTIGQATIHGWGLWRIAPIEAPGDDLEVRIWTAGRKGTVKVYAMSVQQLDAPKQHYVFSWPTRAGSN